MTEDRTTEIAERLNAITPTPWLLVPELCGPNGQAIVNEEDLGPICEVGDPYPRGNNHPQENMTFLVNAPDDIAWLLGEVVRLRAELVEQAKRQARQIVDVVGPLVEAAVRAEYEQVGWCWLGEDGTSHVRCNCVASEHEHSSGEPVFRASS